VSVFPLAGATVLSLLAGWRGVAGLGLVLTVGVALFFRDPERIIPQTPESIVAPADKYFFVAVGWTYQPCSEWRGGTKRYLYARTIPGGLSSGGVIGQ